MSTPNDQDTRTRDLLAMLADLGDQLDRIADAAERIAEVMERKEKRDE